MGVKFPIWSIWIGVGLFIALLLSCVQGNCRQDGSLIVVPKFTEVTQQQISTKKGEKQKKGNLSSLKKKADEKKAEKRVLVFKYDGSKQCERGKTISLETMAKQLKGIRIYSQQKKMDSLAHIQICGEATGRTNVYEISKEDLKKAQVQGFKEWPF